jgi:hypothetical protein
MIAPRDPATIPPLRVGALLSDTPHALIGGHAVNVWVEPRFTVDIDLTIDADRTALEEIAARFAVDGFLVTDEHGPQPPAAPDFLRLKSSDGRIVVEFQIAKMPFQHELIRRARCLESGLRVATPEDLVVLKLIANRYKDARDLIDLCVLPDLDWAHIQRWARVFEIEDRIAEYRSQAS